MSDKPLVLCVDDEPDVVRSLKTTLRKVAKVEIATSGAEGLALAREKGPFAVVVSDMRMPEMNGAEFLTKMRELSPDTVRLLLTGQTDLESAILAVNGGRIFRFLTKPCGPEELIPTIQDAAEQNRLLGVERKLLQETLLQSVGALAEVLSLVNPETFQRAHRLRAVARHLSAHFGLADAWRFEVAAMLSQIGCIALPPTSMARATENGYPQLGADPAFDKHPEVGSQLVSGIPRLEEVSEMIALQLEPPDASLAGAEIGEWPDVALGAEFLRTGLHLEGLMICGASVEGALAKMSEKGDWQPALLSGLETLDLERAEHVRAECSVEELMAGMVLRAAVEAKNGVVIASGGLDVTPTLIARLKNFKSGIGVQEPIQVMKSAQS